VGLEVLAWKIEAHNRRDLHGSTRLRGTARRSQYFTSESQDHYEKPRAQTSHRPSAIESFTILHYRTTTVQMRTVPIVAILLRMIPDMR
jgi:hypothetical protein